MAKLTQAQRRQLETIAYHLDRAAAFIARPEIAVCALAAHPGTTTLHYDRADGTSLYPLAKDIGSDLTGLDMGRQYLRNMLATVEGAK